MESAQKKFLQGFFDISKASLNPFLKQFHHKKIQRNTTKAFKQSLNIMQYCELQARMKNNYRLREKKDLILFSNVSNTWNYFPIFLALPCHLCHEKVVWCVVLNSYKMKGLLAVYIFLYHFIVHVFRIINMLHFRFLVSGPFMILHRFQRYI